MAFGVGVLDEVEAGADGAARGVDFTVFGVGC
jgi:hypothetical protein